MPYPRRRTTVFLVASALLCLVMALSWGIFRKNSHDNDSREIAIGIGQELFTSNDFDSIIATSHPSLKETSSPQPLQDYVQYSKGLLGELQSIESISGSSNAVLNPFSQALTTATYVLDMGFSEGVAQLQLDMMLENGQWRISELSILSDLLNE